MANKNGLDKHNSYRRNHNSPNLVLDGFLRERAQRYAELLANTGTFDYSPEAKQGTYGENLLMDCTFPNAPNIQCKP